MTVIRKTTYDPLKELITYYAGAKEEAAAEKTEAGTLEDRLKQRVIDGDRVGLNAALDEALQSYAPLEIINGILLDGMKTVGELFGSGQMQLPFVLQSAEVMKAAVGYLEQFMDKAASQSKGILVIATVKGDVHDIGKNLVDIILSNNGYKVVNLGIKCPVETMIHAVQEHSADALGMSGLLVKSTLVMKENLEVMNEQGITVPVVLGGAALTRRFVEDDLRRAYRGHVAYANDAFDGLRFMEQVLGGTLAGGQKEEEEEQVPVGSEAKIALAQAQGGSASSMVSHDVPIPHPPFWGTKIVEDIPLDDIFRFVNDVALIRGQWQVKKGKLEPDAYQAMLNEKILPALEELKGRIKNEKLLQPKVAYGYFPCNAENNDLVVYRPDSRTEWLRFTFPRQRADRHLCLADYFAPVGSGRTDVVAFQLVTMGRKASEHSAKLFNGGDFREYLYFHGFSVEAAEALAEYWHKRIREELGIAGNDAKEMRRLFAQGYQGSRYSFGYPACPNLEDQSKIFTLLDGRRIGVKLTDEFSLDPEQSTNAIIVHHPEARYYTVA